jgi:hypothetical protein
MNRELMLRDLEDAQDQFNMMRVRCFMLGEDMDSNFSFNMQMRIQNIKDELLADEIAHTEMATNIIEELNQGVVVC